MKALITTPEGVRMQHALAEEGKALNQCACGAYRSDGLPPVLHMRGCSRE